MKVLFQRLWELKLGWDDEIPEELQQQHLIWKGHTVITDPTSRERTTTSTTSTSSWSQHPDLISALTKNHVAVQPREGTPFWRALGGSSEVCQAAPQMGHWATKA